MKYFVTGATGFIGTRLVHRLASAGHTVHALARFPGKARDLQLPGVQLHRGDVTDRESMRGPMTGVDGVFHLAGWYKLGLRDTSQAVTVNVEGTRNVLELMRDLAVPRGVYTSSLVVFSDTHGAVADESYRFTGEYLSTYERTKAIAHYRVAEPMMAAGLPLVIVQPGAVYGPGDTSMVRRTLLDFLRRRLPVAPRGLTLCWAHVEDVVDGHLRAMERGEPGESYIIGGPAHEITEVLAIVARISGVPAPRIGIAPSVLKGLAAAAGIVERLLPLPAPYSSEMLRVNAGVTYLGSSAKAERELGFRARPLEEGMRETVLHEMRLLGMVPPAGS